MRPAATAEGSITSEEHAERAILSGLVLKRGGSFGDVRKKFAKPNSLTQTISTRAAQLIVEGRDGVSDDQEKRMLVIERLAEEVATRQEKLPLS